MKYIYTITLLLMFISIGCVDIDQDEDYDKSELLKILDEDDAAGIDGFDDGGLLDLDYDMGLELIGSGRTLGDTLAYGEGYRIRFGRQITDRERTVDFTIDGDTAIGVVHHLSPRAPDHFIHAVQPTDGHRAFAGIVSNHGFATEHFYRSASALAHGCSPRDAGPFGHRISAGKSARAGSCRIVTDDVEGSVPGQRLCRADDWYWAAGVAGE